MSLIVILALVGWGGYKGAVWWYADQTLSELRRSLSGEGMLERGRIGSAVSGELTLEDTRYQSFRLTQPLVIRHLHFRAGSPVALLKSLHSGHDLPRSWRLEAGGWRLPLDTAMLRNWVTDADDRSPRPLFMPVCAPDTRQQLGTGDLIRMGINDLAGDAQLRQSSGGVRLDLHTRDAGGLEIFWEGARLRLDNDGASFMPAAKTVQVTLRDGGLMRRVAAYCARETGLPPAAWADLVMTSFREGLQSRGLEASPQLMALYRQWLTEGGELTVTTASGSGKAGLPVLNIVNEESLAGPAGSQVQVTYNGAGIPDIYLSPIDPVAPEVPEEALEPVVVEQPAPVIAGWQAIHPDQAADWLGHRVRVTLSNGRQVEGRLTRVDERQVEVARPVEGGEVAYPMARRAVDELTVWRRGQRAAP